MFKTNPDSMRMEPTPERVLSVCRMVARGPITRQELRHMMTLGKSGDKEVDEINRSITVALEELKILKTKDDHLELAISKDILASSESFRKHVSRLVFSKKDTTFVLFSKWVVSQNDRIWTMKNWEVMAKTCSSEISELSAINENGVLGWQFWAAFLGLGYLNGTNILPNMKTRLQDILATSFSDSFKYGEQIRATDFISWLSLRLPEADLSGKLPLAVSAGLRTLHELNLIKLETWRDSNRVMLFFVDGDPINDFSHITVREEVCQ